MRVTIPASDLANALKHAVAPRGATTMPVLQCARLVAQDQQLSIETTDTEVYLRQALPARVEAEGATCLPVAALQSIASIDGDMLLRDDGRINRGRSHFTLPQRPANDFPMPEESQFAPLELDPQALAAALRQVAYAASDGDVRPFCRAVHVVPGMAWATNGFQLARVALPGYAGPELRLPAAQVKRLLGELVEGAQLVHAEGRMLRVTRDAMQFTVRCLDLGRVPNVADALRALHKEPVCIPKRALEAAIRSLQPFLDAEGKADPVMVLTRANEGGLALSSRDQRATEYLPAECAAFDDALPERLGLPARQLLAGLAAIDSDTVELYAPETGRVALLPAGANESDIYHLQMTYKL